MRRQRYNNILISVWVGITMALLVPMELLASLPFEKAALSVHNQPVQSQHRHAGHNDNISISLNHTQSKLACEDFMTCSDSCKSSSSCSDCISACTTATALNFAVISNYMEFSLETAPYLANYFPDFTENTLLRPPITD